MPPAYGLAMAEPGPGLWVDDARRTAGIGDRVLPLSPSEVAVLAALVAAEGRVVSRTELTRRAGLAGRSPRRCDSVIVRLRQVLGPAAVHTVRSRGWRLPPVDQ